MLNYDIMLYGNLVEMTINNSSHKLININLNIKLIINIVITY